jgi:hypothetical protein
MKIHLKMKGRNGKQVLLGMDTCGRGRVDGEDKEDTCG